LNFDDDAHKYFVDLTVPATVGLDFGNQIVITSLVTVPDVPAVEASLAAGTPLFGSSLVPGALSFFASSIVLSKDKGTPLDEAQLKAGFEFGFVQGILQFDTHLDYWAPRKSDGRVVLHIGMPGMFEVDTEPSIQPWTRAAAGRFKVERVPTKAGKSGGLKVSAAFVDHPLFFLNTPSGTPPASPGSSASSLSGGYSGRSSVSAIRRQAPSRPSARRIGESSTGTSSATRTTERLARSKITRAVTPFRAEVVRPT
jgi:hypothetical protein